MVEAITGAGNETVESRRPKRIRTENPITGPLVQDFIANQRFTEIVNGLSKTEGGVQVPLPQIITVASKYEMSPSRYKVVSLPHNGSYAGIKESIRGFARLTFLTEDISEASHKQKTRLGSKRKEEFVISRDFDGSASDPQRVDGFVVRPDKIDVGYSLRNNQLSEVEFAYEVLICALVASGKIDLSTEEKQAESLDTRRRLFMQIYQAMLEEYIPIAKLDDIYGVDDQIDEIKTNLYSPLNHDSGHPMNVLLVGAPGVGKSLVSRYFLGHKDVMTVSLPVSSLQEGYFERQLLPELNRIKYSLSLPIVVHIDDIEIILESGMSMDNEGRVTQVIDPEDRSRALTLLERLEDTHEIYILGTLNHPDVEAAFLRRFHPVYFPLPSEEIRRRMIGEILSQESPDRNEHQAIIDRIAQETKGFNYNSIALIPRYIENSLIDQKSGTRAEYNDALDKACKWARARAGINKLDQVDKTARKMVGLSDE